METAKTKPFNYRLTALGGMPKIKGGVIAESLLYLFGNKFVIVKESLKIAESCEKKGDYEMAIEFLRDAKDAVSPFKGKEAPTLYKKITRKINELNGKMSAEAARERYEGMRDAGTYDDWS